MKKCVLLTRTGVPESLNNLCDHRVDVMAIHDAVEDSKDGKELLSKMKELRLLRTFSPDRETEEYVRLRAVDRMGNISYFMAYK